MSITAEEIATQPECWERAAGLVPGVAGSLPATGEKVAVVGCGTSWFMAQSYAVLRERAGRGVTDAFAASEFPYGRDYDRIVAITRSGTTTEVLELLRKVRGMRGTRGTVRTTAVIGDPDTPIVDLVDDLVVLDFADEKSVVQTRFATSVLALLRTHLGEDIAPAVADARRAIAEVLSPDLLGAEQFSFLGTGWSYGIALEAGLKMREAAGAWTESYPAMEYRHGPISITGPNRIAWVFGDLPEGLDGDVARTGGTLEASGTDPLADLIRVQRLAVAIAEANGLNPDTPRNLTRSVVLT